MNVRRLVAQLSIANQEDIVMIDTDSQCLFLLNPRSGRGSDSRVLGAVGRCAASDCSGEGFGKSKWTVPCGRNGMPAAESKRPTFLGRARSQFEVRVDRKLEFVLEKSNIPRNRFARAGNSDGIQKNGH
jgi:hypothetical protein